MNIRHFTRYFIFISGDATIKESSMRPEYEIIGDESSGRIDYA